MPSQNALKLSAIIRRAQLPRQVLMMGILLSILIAAAAAPRAAETEADPVASFYGALPNLLAASPDLPEGANEILDNLRRLYDVSPQTAGDVFATLDIGADCLRLLKKDPASLNENERVSLDAALAGAIKNRIGQVNGPPTRLIEAYRDAAGDIDGPRISNDARLASALLAPKPADAPFLFKSVREQLQERADFLQKAKSEYERSASRARMQRAKFIERNLLRESCAIDQEAYRPQFDFQPRPNGESEETGEGDLSPHDRYEKMARERGNQYPFLPWKGPPLEAFKKRFMEGLATQIVSKASYYNHEGERYLLVELDPRILAREYYETTIPVEFAGLDVLIKRPDGSIKGFNGERKKEIIFRTLKDDMHLVELQLLVRIRAAKNMRGTPADAPLPDDDYQLLMKIWREIREAGRGPDHTQARKMLRLLTSLDHIYPASLDYDHYNIGILRAFRDLEYYSEADL